MNLTPIKANMNELETEDLAILFSYSTPVAFFNKETGMFYKTVKKWSQTTTRHINQWLSRYTDRGYQTTDVCDIEQKTIDKIVEVR